LGFCFEGLDTQRKTPFPKAIVATVLPEAQRNFAFGLYYAGYWVGWLIGSVVACLLYEQSLTAMVIFAVTAQLASLPIFVLATRIKS
jgi:hypothetical protein